jgi:hypothetical protein
MLGQGLPTIIAWVWRSVAVSIMEGAAKIRTVSGVLSHRRAVERQFRGCSRTDGLWSDSFGGVVARKVGPDAKAHPDSNSGHVQQVAGRVGAQLGEAARVCLGLAGRAAPFVQVKLMIVVRLGGNATR